MNRSNKGANTNIIQMCEDALVLLLVYFIERKAFENVILKETYPKCLALVVVFGAIYILSNKEARIYNVTMFFYTDRFWRIISRSWTFAAAATTALMYAYNPHVNIRRFHIHYMVVSYIAICINMVVSRFIQMAMTGYNAPRAAYVGTFGEYEKFNYFLNKTSVRIKEVGYILMGEPPVNRVFNVIGTIDNLEQIIRQNELDQIYFMQHSDDNIDQIQEYIDICLEMGITVRVVMDVSYSRRMKRSDSFVSSVGTFPVITYHTITLNSYERLIKRIMDLFIGTIMLIVLLPFFFVTALMVRVRGNGKIFVKETRIGQNGRRFNIYKYSEKTGIDIFLQLINVLRGDMSLVGIKPSTETEAAQYKRSQYRRISIKPGMTGLWKIAEREGEKTFDQIVEADLVYIDNWNLGNDVKIMLRTVANSHFLNVTGEAPGDTINDGK